MASKGVVILSGFSLFAEGTASSLRRSMASLQISVVDPRDEQVLEKIAELAPRTVILDMSDAAVEESCPVTVLLDLLPDLRIIRLDPGTEEIQIVSGEHRRATNIAELIEVISSEETDPARE
jgi:hypothetical protein